MDHVSKNNDIVNGKLKAGETIFIPDAVEFKKSTTDRIASRSTGQKKHIEVNERKEKDNSERDIEKTNINIKRAVAFMWPLRGRITSGFGSRSDPFSGRRSFHNGIDISAEQGTPVKACADGEVIFSGWKDGYGNLVVLKHTNGYISVYGHNSVLKKNEGDIVSRGEIVSLSGMTGAVTGAHLHFEIQKYQTPLNPLRMMK
jgi:murein DD-endopeptidase MepM/ murein hydrolase activator NlpD